MSKKISSLLALAVMLPALLLNSCNKKNADNPAQQLAINDSAAVKVFTVEKGTIAVTKSYIGNVEGQKQTGVYPKMSEKIAAVKVRIGDRVKEDDILFQLDKTGPASQYRQLEFALENQARDLERMKNLLKDGAVSQQTVDATQTQYNVTKTNLEAAVSALNITAPISGVITALNGDLGDLAIPSISLATISDVSNLIVKFSVGEKEISRFKTGNKLTITADADTSVKIQAAVSKVTGIADLKTRTLEVEATFANQNGLTLFPGMFCKISAELSSKKDILVIPNEAILTEGDTRLVFAAVNGTAVKRPVQTGITNSLVTEITGGLEPGEQVITTGIGSIKDGSKINIIK